MKNSWNKATSHMHTCTSAFLSDSRAKAFSATLPLFWKIETARSALTPPAPGSLLLGPRAPPYDPRRSWKTGWLLWGGAIRWGRLGPEPRLPGTSLVPLNCPSFPLPRKTAVVKTQVGRFS